MNLPTQEHIRSWLHYDPATGLFIWLREPRSSRPLIGTPPGTMRCGYVVIKLRGFGQIGAHRLAWIYMFGVLPNGMEIDHKDNNPANNAIDNLRLASSQQQKRNKRVQSNNRSGLKGAYFHACHKGKKWRAQIKIAVGSGKGKVIFLGYFHTAQEAHEAYTRAAPKYFGEFARAV